MNSEINISRLDLIKICDQFLDGQIKELEIEKYAAQLISQDKYIWDDEVISEIVFQWDNQTINYPITIKNIELWKQQLETNENLLNTYNNWNSHIRKQQEVCKKHQSKWSPINNKLMIGVGPNLDKGPFNGLRHPREKGTTGWYIWSGEYSEKDDFFKPMCAEHLLQIRPELIKYLALDEGFRFLFDKNGYEDVWYDEQLLKI